MKFMALFKKELRECLPWMLGAGAVLLLLGSLILHFEIVNWGQYSWYGQAGSGLDVYQLMEMSPLRSIGPLMLCLALAFGLVLGGRQFWMPGFDKTWSFMLHRSVKRSTILWAKFAAATVSFVVGLGIIWTIFYAYSSRPGVFPIPPGGRVFIEGWIFIILGLVAYLGTGLTGLSQARWYTTKTFGIAFAGGICLVVFIQASLAGCFLFIFAGVVMLVSQIICVFLNREF